MNPRSFFALARAFAVGVSIILCIAPVASALKVVPFPSDVKILPSDPVVESGKTIRFRAGFRRFDGKWVGLSPRWSVSNKAAGTIDAETGLFTTGQTGLYKNAIIATIPAPGNTSYQVYTGIRVRRPFPGAFVGQYAGQGRGCCAFTLTSRTFRSLFIVADGGSMYKVKGSVRNDGSMSGSASFGNATASVTGQINDTNASGKWLIEEPLRGDTRSVRSGTWEADRCRRAVSGGYLGNWRLYTSGQRLAGPVGMILLEDGRVLGFWAKAYGYEKRGSRLSGQWDVALKLSVEDSEHNTFAGSVNGKSASGWWVPCDSGNTEAKPRGKWSAPKI